MHDASKMLQIYVCYSHASLLSKEDKTTPKAWRRRHQWIAWRRVVASEWVRASYCKTHILLRCGGVQMLIASSRRDALTCTALNGYV